MLIKRGDVKILSVLEEEELNEQQKQAVKKLAVQHTNTIPEPKKEQKGN